MERSRAATQFQQALKVSSHLLLLAGFLALFASGGVGWLWSAAFLASLGLSWREKVMVAPSWLQVFLVLFFLGAFLVDLVGISGFVGATVHLLVLLCVVKLLSRNADRDYLLLYFLSFAFLLMASTFTISLRFLASLVAYVFFAILTFILFESRRAYAENRTAEFSVSGYFNAAVVLTALITLLSVPIFLLIPRNSLGLLRVEALRSDSLSGFSDQVVLGDIGRIIQNPQIVMRVRMDRSLDELPDDLKWRGIALDRYDGRVWVNTDRSLRPLHSAGDFPSFLVVRERRSSDQEFLVRQQVSLEPIGNILFGIPDVVMISGTDLAETSLMEDGNGTFLVSSRRRETLRYTVDSDLFTRSQRLARPIQGEIPARILVRYLQLADVDPRVELLARQVTAPYPTDLEKALALERYLKNHFGYSLENLLARTQDPLYDFLFTTRSGHCEYFATAHAVMLRTLGIPARLVNGFRSGEYNRWGEYFIVRQSDAHSWVEAYFPGTGWIEFDPTPASDRPDLPYLVRAAGQILDSLDLFWTEVITFDRFKQAGMFRHIALSLNHAAQDLTGLLRAFAALEVTDFRIAAGKWPVWIGIGGVILLAGGIAAASRYRRSLRVAWMRRVLGRADHQLAPEYYLEMLDILESKGFRKNASETPVEFVQRISKRLSHPAPVRLTQLYYSSRFGSLALDGEELVEVHRLLDSLRN